MGTWVVEGGGHFGGPAKPLAQTTRQVVPGSWAAKMADLSGCVTSADGVWGPLWLPAEDPGTRTGGLLTFDD